MPKKSPPLALIAPFIGGFGSLVFAGLCHYRLLPFLKADMILSGGRYIPTQDFAEMLTRLFLAFAPASILLGVLQYYLWRKKMLKKESIS